MPENSANPSTVHATSVSINGSGVLLRGRPGSGKSDLALRLIEKGAVLVSDDQVTLNRQGKTINASPPSRLAGLLEVRGVGICQFEFVENCQVKLVVDVDQHSEQERLPDASHCRCVLMGLTLPCFQLNPFQASATAKIAAMLKKSIAGV